MLITIVATVAQPLYHGCWLWVCPFSACSAGKPHYHMTEAKRPQEKFTKSISPCPRKTAKTERFMNAPEATNTSLCLRIPVQGPKDVGAPLIPVDVLNVMDTNACVPDRNTVRLVCWKAMKNWKNGVHIAAR